MDWVPRIFLTSDNKVHDEYRIDYLRNHIRAIRESLADGVNVFGYCPWSFMDLLSSHQGLKSVMAWYM